MTHPYFRRASTPRVFAHRGLVHSDGAAMPVFDNTLAAVAQAHAAGAEYVEIDCWRTADDVVVVFHDRTLERLLGDRRAVSEVHSEELAAMLEPHGGLLQLHSALDAFPTLRFNLDVKDPGAAVPAGRIVAPFAERVLLTSFDDRTRLRALAAARAEGGAPATSAGRNLLARILLALKLRRTAAARRLIARVDALQIPVAHGPLQVLSPALIEAAHAVGAEIHVWTVNEVSEMLELIARGADGIVTDRADLALAALR